MENTIREIIVAEANKNKGIDKSIFCHKTELELTNGILASNIHIMIDEIGAIYDEVNNLVEEVVVEETPLEEEV